MFTERWERQVLDDVRSNERLSFSEHESRVSRFYSPTEAPIKASDNRQLDETQNLILGARAQVGCLIIFYEVANAHLLRFIDDIFVKCTSLSIGIPVEERRTQR